MRRVMRGGMRPGALVLAAGLGRRMGGPKALLRVDGAPLVEHHVARFRELGCAPIVVVVRPELAREVSALVDATVVAAATGSQAESLRVGIGRFPDAVLVTPVDLVPPRAATIQALLDAWSDDVDAVTPTHIGRGGHPVLLRASVVTDMDRLDAFLDALGDRRLKVAVDDAAIHGDLDVPADLATALVCAPLSG